MSTKNKLTLLKESNKERVNNLRNEIKAWIGYTLWDADEAEKRFLDPYFSYIEEDGVKSFFILNKKGDRKINVDVANVYDLGFFFKKETDFDAILEMMESAKVEKEINLYLNSLGF